jgi:predicted amino acid-binding ACT domain protein
MTSHAMEEMAEDDLDIHDVEQAVLNGYLASVEKPESKKTHAARST